MIPLLLALACGGPTAAPADVTPAPIGLAECVVCGMVVAEQPAPRGQAVHRDGTHAHLCSLGDLRAYVQAPNPRGAPLAVYVETLADPRDLTLSTDPLPWTPAAQAHYVAAPERRAVMGHALLAFTTRDDAEVAARATGERVVGWDTLIETPFTDLP